MTLPFFIQWFCFKVFEVRKRMQASSPFIEGFTLQQALIEKISSGYHIALQGLQVINFCKILERKIWIRMMFIILFNSPDQKWNGIIFQKWIALIYLPSIHWKNKNFKSKPISSYTGKIMILRASLYSLRSLLLSCWCCLLCSHPPLETLLVPTPQSTLFPSQPCPVLWTQPVQSS